MISRNMPIFTHHTPFWSLTLTTFSFILLLTSVLLFLFFSHFPFFFLPQFHIFPLNDIGLYAPQGGGWLFSNTYTSAKGLVKHSDFLRPEYWWHLTWEGILPVVLLQGGGPTITVFIAHLGGTPQQFSWKNFTYFFIFFSALDIFFYFRYYIFKVWDQIILLHLRFSDLISNFQGLSHFQKERGHTGFPAKRFFCVSVSTKTNRITKLFRFVSWNKNLLFWILNRN